MVKLAVVVAGMARAGKDTAADYISEKYGFSKFVFSDILGEMLIKEGKEATKQNMIILGRELREKHGMGILGIKMLERIRGKEQVVLVGARSPEELDEVAKGVEKIVVIRIEAAKEKRFSRKSELDPKKENEFFERDRTDFEEKGMAGVLEKADSVVENNSGIEELRQAIDKALEKLGIA